MGFTVEQFAEVDVIRLPRRVMMADAPSIRTDIRKMVERGRKNIVLDLSDVAFIDSSGWGRRPPAKSYVHRPLAHRADTLAGSIRDLRQRGTCRATSGIHKRRDGGLLI